MSRASRTGEPGKLVGVRAAPAEREQWERAAKQAGHPTLSAAVVAVMNTWARRVLRGGKRR
jgi:hypothetical protein